MLNLGVHLCGWGEGGGEKVGRARRGEKGRILMVRTFGMAGVSEEEVSFG